MHTCKVRISEEVSSRSTATRALTYSPNVDSLLTAWPLSKMRMTDSESPLLFRSRK
jgi:hypothetical protein